MVKPGPKPPGEHNKVESKKLHKLGRFPNLRAAGRTARKAFSWEGAEGGGEDGWCHRRGRKHQKAVRWGLNAHGAPRAILGHNLRCPDH